MMILFFRQLLSNYHENYIHHLEPPEKSIKIKETIRKAQIIIFVPLTMDD